MTQDDITVIDRLLSDEIQLIKDTLLVMEVFRLEADPVSGQGPLIFERELADREATRSRFRRHFNLDHS